MILNHTRSRLLASSVLCGALALGAASAAHAQAADSSTVGEIVVTGTRIKGLTNQTSPSPISVATAASIALTKANSIEEVLQHLTGADFTGGISNASNNGGAGVSAVGLRQLGPNRTLVLLDGERLIPQLIGAGSTSSVVDLNSIPLSMVERVEVLRDGASSVYGADAIGGVINIITKKNAEGMTFDASYGESGHGDGQVYSVGSTVALNSDRGNVMVGIDWDHRDAIAASDRKWATDPHINDVNNSGGSTYRSQLNILQQENGDAAFANGNLLDVTDPNVNWTGISPALVYLPNSGAVKYSANAPGFGNTLTGGLDRKQISFNSHYDLTPDVRFVASGFYTDRTSTQLLRPEPLLGDAIANSVFPGFVIPDDAPGRPTTAGSILPTDAPPGSGGSGFLAFLTPNQFGPRSYHEDSKAYRIRTGFEGTLFGKYDWEAGYVYQQQSARADVNNEGNFDHLSQITEQSNCVDVPGGCHTAAVRNINGQLITSVPNQQPNWFNGPNNIFTPAQIAYLTFDNVDSTRSSESYAYANVSGPLFTLPAGEVKGSVGGELRKEHEDDTPDTLVQEGFGPNQAAPTSGGYDVGSVYGEIRIPLVKDFPFVKALNVDYSARYDTYSTFGGAFTNKVGLEWEVNHDLRFRGSYATGFRAPSVAELFGGDGLSDNGANGDPCDGRGPVNGNTNAGILTAGSTCSVAVAHGAAVPTTFAPSEDNVKGDQIQVLQGGNTALKPESSESYSAGLVFSPHWVPGLTFSVDYYNVRISNAILAGGIAGNASPDLVLNGCYGAAQNQAFCSLITRSATGNITSLNSLNTNFGTEKVRGMDYELSYDTGLAGWHMMFPGAFNFDVQLSNLIKHTTENPDNTSNSYAGTFQYSSESIQPRWKGIASVEYREGPWTAHYDMTYTSAMDEGPLPTASGDSTLYGNRIPDMFYHNISGSYSFSDWGVVKKGRLTVGIDNVADQDPPFLSGDSTCKCNSLAGPFDFVGRFYYVKLSSSF
jgi:iron complex outermembrane receptor protein